MRTDMGALQLLRRVTAVSLRTWSTAYLYVLFIDRISYAIIVLK